MISKLTIRIAIVQALFITVAFSSDGIAQENISVKKVSINVGFENADLFDVIKTIEKKTGYRFIYDSKDIKNRNGFSIKPKTRSVEDLLIELSKNYNLQFKQVNYNISVKQKLANSTKEEAPVQIIIQGIEIVGKVISSDDNLGIVKKLTS